MAIRQALNSFHVRSLLVLLLAVTPALLGILSAGAEWRQHDTAEAEAASLQLAHHAAAIYERVIEETEHFLSLLASTLPAAPTAHELEDLLVGAPSERMVLANVGVVTPAGRLVRAARPTTADAPERLLFRRAAETRRFAIGSYEPGVVNGKRTVTVAYPVVDRSGQLSHVLFAVLSPDWLRELAIEASFPEAATVSILDEHGTIVMQEPDMPERVGRSGLQDYGLKALPVGPAETRTEAVSADGTTRLFVIKPLRADAGGLFVVVGIPKQVVTAIADGSLARINNWFLIAVGLAIVVATVGNRVTVLRPLRLLTDTTKRLSEGDLGARTGLRHLPEELKDLSKAFDDMGEALQQRERDIALKNEQLRRAHDELEARVRTRTSELLAANVALQAEIGHRARVEETLRRLSRAIEQTSDCVFMTDHAGVIEYVNPAFVQLTGYSADEAIGSNPSLIKSEHHDRRFYERLWSTIKSGEVFRTVFTNRTKDGRLIYQDSTITPLRDRNGAITNFVSTGRDITKLRRAAEALRRLNDRLEYEATRIASALHDDAGQFLTAAHITLADVARDLPPESRNRLQDVRRNLDEVEQQLRRLAHELRPRIVDDMGLEGALKFLADGVARRSGIPINVEVSLRARCKPMVEIALYRLVQEGLTNMSKHARASRATVVLSQTDESIQCSVKDDGVGFEMTGTPEQREGLGLGLFGIQDRLEAVDGVLEVISSPGRGTELRATVPLES